MRSKYADSERGCADVGLHKCGLVGESAQMWGEASGRVWGICMAEANQFARCCYLCGGDLSR